MPTQEPPPGSQPDWPHLDRLPMHEATDPLAGTGPLPSAEDDPLLPETPIEVPQAPTSSHKLPRPATEPQPGTRDAARVTLVWSNGLGQGESDPTGPQPGALLQGYRLLEATGVLRWRTVSVVAPDLALGQPEALGGFHTPEYLQAVAALSGAGAEARAAPERFGFWGAETVPFPGMAEIAGRFVAATRTAVRLAMAKPTARLVVLAGQQVHAQTARAASGGIFNDVVLALLDARAAGGRVAFLNLDAEHPGVVQEHFYHDPHLLCLSLHEAPAFLYPGTGHTHETGAGDGRGFTANVPLPPGAGDAEMLAAWDGVLRPLLERFAPTLIVLLGGPSAHFAEPLAHLRMTASGYTALVEGVAALTPRLVLLGGQGTDWASSARLWAGAITTLAGRKAERAGSAQAEEARPQPLPAPLQSYVTEFVQESVHRAQRALFPLWGLPVPPDAGRPFELENTFGPDSAPSVEWAYQREVQQARRAEEEEATRITVTALPVEPAPPPRPTRGSRSRPAHPRREEAAPQADQPPKQRGERRARRPRSEPPLPPRGTEPTDPSPASRRRRARRPGTQP